MKSCKKCGEVLVDVVYIDKKDMLQYICKRCGYVWLERPLDYVEKEETTAAADEILLEGFFSNKKQIDAR